LHVLVVQEGAIQIKKHAFYWLMGTFGDAFPWPSSPPFLRYTV